MKVAFDVKGTIEGPHKAKVLKLFKAFQDLGCEMTVWSNLYSYAVNAVKDNNLNAEAMSKKMMLDYENESEAMDVCIEDDTMQTWLGARRIVFVHEIPDDVESFAKQLMKGA